MSHMSQLESILFVASKPLSRQELLKTLSIAQEKLDALLVSLREKYNQPDSGLQLLDTGATVQLVTHPDNAEVVVLFTKQELMGELTRAQLETLTVIAYQGPATRPEIEAIRGVNCSIILRNLTVRGLVEEEESVDKLMTAYRISAAALRQLGIMNPTDLPQYSELHAHPYITAVVSEELDSSLSSS